MVHSIQIDEVLAKISGATARDRQGASWDWPDIERGCRYRAQI